ncbi:MAG TPA: hypothetical protein ENI17_04115 [Pseudomonas xinjiangensis]|uniref:Carboxylesterase type B domain-containing protein n=2 Tax=root TaxID=1 RepID=A0A7V1FSL8_9GAMM|nr:hypothetical protein [Halopseudomonas xinjiangensis]HEC46794.1 hypothetical protein [Halopseudomonas xinjiangensis]
MTMKASLARPRFLLSSLSMVIIAASLGGCLSGSGSDSDAATPPPANPLIATTAQGDVQGVELTNMRVFRGIPYAAPPVRFAAPEPALNRASTLQLTEDFGADCAQPGGTFGSESTAEDCLFLNVYAPQAPGDYPVMLWIHGGAFVTGSGGASYEPSRLVEQGVVVVTINYRLGALGFLPHSSLADESGNYGNYGLMDQQEALRWVQENISAFDGDPDNVTIFGESAGGHSVLSHVVSPSSEGLFHKAIVQSGAYNPTQVSQAAGQIGLGTPFVEATGCDEAADTGQCLRGLPVATVLANQLSNYIPVVNATNTGILPLSIDAGLSSGDFNQAPMLMGSNQDEGRLFVAIDVFSQRPVTADNYQTKVNDLLALDPRPYPREPIAEDYLIDTREEGIATTEAQVYPLALAAIQTDWRFACPNLNQLNQVRSAQVPVWGYWFTDRNAPNILGASPGFPLGATHAFEIQYVLNNEAALQQRGATEAQIELSRRMVEYWANFAKFSDPNSTDGAAGAVTWDGYTGLQGNLLDLDPVTLSQVPATEFVDYHSCAYWANPQ